MYTNKPENLDGVWQSYVTSITTASYSRIAHVSILDPIRDVRKRTYTLVSRSELTLIHAANPPIHLHPHSHCTIKRLRND